MKQIFYTLLLIIAFSFATVQAQNYSTHKVKQGETIESIAKRYHVTPYDIFSLNPDAKKELKINTILIIPKSKISVEPKVTIVKELKGFKDHKVKRKETLYSLSQKYSVNQEDIKKHNPSLYSENLQKGDRIKIPLYKTTQVVEQVKDLTKPYQVLPKEGKWRIAYKFGITVTELEALNPNMNPILKEGELINVPNISLNEVKEVDDKYSYYKVLPREGFYRLKLKHDLEQEELESLNPGLSESGLKEGMILKIPFSNSIENSNVDSATINLISQIKDYETKHIAIMLPFKLNQVDLDSVYDTKEEIKKGSFLSVSLDYYSGTLLALDSLKKLGISLKVDVYDTKNQVSEVSRILRNNDFETVDVVIGPIMPNNLEKVASELNQFNIPVISPITKKIKLSENVFQSRPSEELLKEKIIAFVKTDTTSKHIIVVADSKNRLTSNELKREFNSAAQVFSRQNKDGEEAYYVIDEDLINVLKPGKNLVFLETKNEGFASNVTSVLNAMISDEIQVVLTTTNKNSAFESDEVSNYHLSNLQFYFPTIAKAYNEDDHNSFVKKYKNVYGVTPNKVAVRGFDITMDVVLRLVTSQDLFMSANESSLTEYVENKFAYQKKLFGGYYNNAVYIVKYDDLKIVEVIDD